MFGYNWKEGVISKPIEAGLKVNYFKFRPKEVFNNRQLSLHLNPSVFQNWQKLKSSKKGRSMIEVIQKEMTWINKEQKCYKTTRSY